jgi:hypothetical protein
MTETMDTEFMPTHFGLFYGGKWHEPVNKGSFDTFSPSTGKQEAEVAEASAEDVDRDNPSCFRSVRLRRALG